MKIYSKLLVPFYFGTTVILLSAGATLEFIKEYSPIVKSSIISFIKKTYRLYNNSKAGGHYNGLSAV